jgi:hypothetical protein
VSRSLTSPVFQAVQAGPWDRLTVSGGGSDVWVGDGKDNIAFLSTDGGRQWSLWPYGATAPTIDPNDERHLVVAGGGGPVAYTTDSAATWNTSSSAGISSVTFAGDGTLWAFTNVAAEQSTDGGASFQLVRAMTPGKILVPPVGNIWLSLNGTACDDGPNRGFCLLYDDGTVHTMPQLPSGADSLKVYLGKDDYVFDDSTKMIERSTDNGLTFAPTGPVPTDSGNGTADPALSGGLYLEGVDGCEGTVIHLSSDGGATFNTIPVSTFPNADAG